MFIVKNSRGQEITPNDKEIMDRLDDLYESMRKEGQNIHTYPIAFQLRQDGGLLLSYNETTYTPYYNRTVQREILLPSERYTVEISR